MSNENIIKLALPKGRIQENVFKLLKDAGIDVTLGARGYRPTISLANFDTKILKPQNIVDMLSFGSRDVGFAGADWVEELGVEVVDLLDTEMNPVRIVAAAPQNILENNQLPKRKITIATEYLNLCKRWVDEKGIDATIIRAWGATEVFPPDDADCIVDNTSTGSTLKANGLQIVDDLMRSSTRLFANPKALENPVKREAIENLVVLCRSVLEARKRVMLEINVSNDKLEEVVKVIPAMGEPTISQLHHEAGYAIKAAVLRSQLTDIIPLIKNRGGTDIVVSSLTQIIP